jgi:hypothetical protein
LNHSLNRDRAEIELDAQQVMLQQELVMQVMQAMLNRDSALIEIEP